MAQELGHLKRITPLGRWLSSRIRISIWNLFHYCQPLSLRSMITSTMSDAAISVRSCESSWPKESTFLRSSYWCLQRKMESGTSSLETLTTDFMLALLCVVTPTGNVFHGFSRLRQATCEMRSSDIRGDHVYKIRVSGLQSPKIGRPTSPFTYRGEPERWRVQSSSRWSHCALSSPWDQPLRYPLLHPA